MADLSPADDACPNRHNAKTALALLRDFNSLRGRCTFPAFVRPVILTPRV